MAGIAYVNGQYLRSDDARVHIEDRGYQFADGIYEVCLVIGGRYWDADGHLDRMDRSLRELQISAPMPRNSLRTVMAELLTRNRLKNALVYIQVTRGVAARNHPFPAPETPTTLVMTAKRFDLDASDERARAGVHVITQPDIRWGRVDIKSVSLLPNVLAKQAASEADAAEALLVRNGNITEGSSSNAWIVDQSDVIITHPKCQEILGGITRETALACARDLQLKIEERPFTPDEAVAAKEAFITAATVLVMPVVAIDGQQIGDGVPGPIAKRLREAYKDRARLA